ncbi:unnamed protein product [Dicrocoelium dendriticum]|nr:unnamed protein product [Dicrocoelium dendriticum]
MVKSTPNHSRHREAIRSTWANPCWTERYKKRYKVLFIMGTHIEEDHSIVHSHLQLEFHNNRDIVQYDFPDTYKLTTRKLLAAWSFARLACPLFRYVLIVDEDFLISPDLVMKTALQVPEREYKDYIGGHLYPRSKPYRNNRSRYYIAHEEYPYPVFPPFLAGGFMLISMPVATRLLDNMVKTQIFLPLDDVTVGLALRRIDVKPQHIRNICLHDYNCKHVAHKARIGVHGFSDPQHLLRDWKRLQLGAAC